MSARAALLLLGLASWASAASEPGPWRRLWGWGSDPARDKYEELFDREYPWRSYDPFNRSFPFEDVRHYNTQFDLRAAGISQRVQESQEGVALLIEWPGSAELALDVSVAEQEVRVVPAAGAAESAGRYRFRARNALAFSSPVPNGADGSTARVTREGDVIRVSFRRAR